jgi:hypothetical protein
MKSGSRREGGATVVGFESGQWLLMISRRRILGQVLTPETIHLTPIFTAAYPMLGIPVEIIFCA